MLGKNQVVASRTVHSMSDEELLTSIYNTEINSYENEIKEKRKELKDLELNLPNYENRFELLMEKYKRAGMVLLIQNILITLAGMYIGVSISQTIFYRHEKLILEAVKTFAPGAMHLFFGLAFALAFGILGVAFSDTYMTKLNAKVERDRHEIETIRGEIHDAEKRIRVLTKRIEAKKQERQIYKFGYSNVTF